LPFADTPSSEAPPPVHQESCPDDACKNCSSAVKEVSARYPLLPTDTTWCPFATGNTTCHNSALCHPCQDRFLFILATGRSASTTLQYMFNSLPGIRMSGENNNELGVIRQMVENLYTSKLANGVPMYVSAEGGKSAWGHNHVPAGTFSCVCQAMVHAMNPPLLTADESRLKQPDDANDIVGFKTIRFLNGVTDENALVDFVQHNFPCSRVIVNIRSDFAEQAESAFYKYDANATHVLSELTARHLRVAELFGLAQAVVLDASVFTHDISPINDVVDWLGFSKECHFQQLLEFNTVHGYGNGKKKLSLDPNCKYLGRSA
jgi:hypothetical protein